MPSKSRTGIAADSALRYPEKVLLESVCVIPVEDYLLTRIVFTPDGHHIVVGHKNLIQYDILSGREVLRFPFEAIVGWLGFSADGRYLACVNENDNFPRTPGLARVFDASSGEILFEARSGHPIEAGCFLEADGTTLFLYKDTVLDAAGGVSYRRSRVRARRLPDEKTVSDLDFLDWDIRALGSIAGTLAVCGRESIPTSREIEGALLAYHPFKLGVYSFPDSRPGLHVELGIGTGPVQFSPDGKVLVCEEVSFRCNERRLSAISVETGARASLLQLSAEVVPALGFASDGSLVLTVCEEAGTTAATLRVWDASTFELAGQAPFGSQYHAVAMNRPTSRIAALGGGRCDISLLHPDHAV